MFFANACTRADPTGNGKVSTASSKARVMLAMVSGLKEEPWKTVILKNPARMRVRSQRRSILPGSV
jgi:hypothetical protein